ncbi:glycosyltransferase family 2 protein [Candidatus Gottesmanbacteria bacterium]|nr:glycosyltransferase family 2 protein [Candidatus Gottesmanbacteria bacterium]
MGISAVVLTQNCASTLAATLESLSFCDEIIVIDDHSTDDSGAIAKKYDAVVYTRSLDGDFAAQRNFGLAKATHDWVLFIDSDEVVSQALAHEIREAIQSVDVKGFYVKRRDILWGTPMVHGETADVRLLRLAKKGSGKWTRPVHEVWNVTGVVGTLEHPLDHTPHPSVADFLSDINHYSTINAAHFYKSGVRVTVWQIIGYPIAKFIRNYVIKRGYKDGTPGIIVALMMSFHSFLTRSKLWHLQKQQA